MTGERRFDLITMGRAIIDIYADQKGCRLEDVSSFSKYVGGCPANIAIGTARLGLKVAMITRVGDEQHGRFLREQLVREGVDVTHVVTDPGRLTGVAFLGISDRETFPLLHYRDDCADMAISPSDYEVGFLRQSNAFLFSGSHLTTEKAAQNVEVAVNRAKAAGTKIIFDIDYRPVFWQLVGRDAGESRYITSNRATVASQQHLHLCDLIVGTEEEIHIAGGTHDTLGALRALRERTAAAIVLKRGASGCVVFPGAIPDSIEEGIIGPGFPVEIFNLVGAGDGFMSGFLSGWLRGHPWEECCRFGNACGAIVVSRHGCSPASPTRTELEFFLSRGIVRPDLHRDEELERIHRATTRRSRPDPAFVIACDNIAPPPLRVEGRTLVNFNLAVAGAVAALRQSIPGLGIIFDDVHGADALSKVGTKLDWVGRKIEQTGASPLAFQDCLPAGALLQEWPRYQIAKCLVADPRGATVLQEERLRELQQAARMTSIELLLQIDPADPRNGLEPASARIREIQALGVLPDWWAVSPSQEWDLIESTIMEKNRECRGVLIFVDARDPQEALRICRETPNSPLIKGFLLSASLFQPFADAWFEGVTSDAELAAQISRQMHAAIHAWAARNSGQSAAPKHTARLA